jgi:hypothetical protein
VKVIPSDYLNKIVYEVITLPPLNGAFQSIVTFYELNVSTGALGVEGTYTA